MSTTPEADIFERLHAVIRDRAGTPRADSYVSGLLCRGLDAIHGKIVEESGELIDASHRQNREAIIHEAADLWFHTLVLLGHHEIDPARIRAELERRWGTSGLTEKAGRAKK